MAVRLGGPKGSSPTWGEARGAATLGAPALRRSHPPATYQTTVHPLTYYPIALQWPNWAERALIQTINQPSGKRDLKQWYVFTRPSRLMQFKELKQV